MNDPRVTEVNRLFYLWQRAQKRHKDAIGNLPKDKEWLDIDRTKEAYRYRRSARVMSYRWDRYGIAFNELPKKLQKYVLTP